MKRAKAQVKSKSRPGLESSRVPQDKTPGQKMVSMVATDLARVQGGL